LSPRWEELYHSDIAMSANLFTASTAPGSVLSGDHLIFLSFSRLSFDTVSPAQVRGTLVFV
jgi:hypothetical protein